MVKRTTAVYAAGHFAVDLACAFCMLRYALGSAGWLLAVLLYNALAFAGQAPLGLLADRFGNGRLFAAGGCLLTAAAFCLPAAPIALAVTAGVGNALYHVGGGRDVLAGDGGRAGPLGVFVSPGAFGLFLGGLMGRGGFPAWPAAALVLLAGAAVLWLCRSPAAAPLALPLDRAGALALAALFLVVFVRSWTGFLFSFPWKTGAWAWVFVLCVVLGKTAGGYLYDRLGAARTAALSLIPAAILFCVPGSAVCGCLAVLLFNMTMPVTLRAAADLLPGARGFSFGLLTFALFLGFLPAYLDVSLPGRGIVYAAAALVSLLLLLPAARRARP